MSVVELDVDEWLTATLADATLAGLAPGGAHQHPAPPATATPYVTIQAIPGPDTIAAGQTRLVSTGLWRVVVWWTEQDAYADAKAAVARVDALLHGQSTQTAAVVVASHRTQPVRVVDQETADAGFVGRGGMYRIWAYPAV